MSKVYFVYSALQMERIKEANLRAGIRNIEFGKVIVGGIPKTYTDIISNPDKLAFADSKILIHGERNQIRYTKPSF